MEAVCKDGFLLRFNARGTYSTHGLFYTPSSTVSVRYTKTRLRLANFTPADLIRLGEPFDSDEYLFELKMDGFRAVAHVDKEGTRLVSRRGNVYRGFPRLCDAIRSEIKCVAVLDGEI